MMKDSLFDCIFYINIIEFKIVSQQKLGLH